MNVLPDFKKATRTTYNGFVKELPLIHTASPNAHLVLFSSREARDMAILRFPPKTSLPVRIKSDNTQYTEITVSQTITRRCPGHDGRRACCLKGMDVFSSFDVGNL